MIRAGASSRNGAEALRKLADRYRSRADATDNEALKARQLGVAGYLDREARKWAAVTASDELRSTGTALP